MLLYQNTFGVTHVFSFLKFTISLRRWAKRIDHLHAEAVEIARIPGGHRQVVDARRGGDHAVFKQIAGLPVHEPRPLSKARAVHRQDPKRSSQSVNPCLDFTSFVPVLFARPFNTSLQLAESRGRQKDLACIQALDPGHHGAMRFRFPQFGNHIRIEKILAHWNSTGTRRRNFRRGGIRFSNRGWGASSSALISGGAALFNRRHSSIGTSTAVSTPRRVTI